MEFIFQKVKINWTLYAQILFTAIAFIAMIGLSYVFMSSIVSENLVDNANSVLDFAEIRTTSTLIEPKTMLEGSSQTIRNLLARKVEPEELQKYIEDISSYILLSGKNTAGERGIYGYFETLAGGPRLIHSSTWSPEPGYNPVERNWYKNAIEADGAITETVPYITEKNETLFTYSIAIFDHDGNRIAVICIDVRIDTIKQNIVDIALEQGGYGMLINQDNVMLAHPNDDFIGRSFADPVVPVSIFSDDLQAGRTVFEQPVYSFRDEASVAFFRELSNGWFIGFVTPKEQYYQSISSMAVILSLLGAALAAILILILIFLDAAKTRSDLESKQKSTFLANMSHEIRTPINAIIGMTTIGKSAENTERKDDCFEKIDNASQHLLGIINDVLDMAKIESDRFELTLSDYNFQALIKRVDGIIGFHVAQKHQKLSFTIDPSIPDVLLCDDQRLIQVIINILSNAVKFTPEEGEIALQADLTKEVNEVYTITIKITDSGIGISPEQQKKIFQPFEQADSGTARKFGGTGLGLVISKRIIEKMGGEIHVTSQLNQGSTFTFTFQARRGESIPESKASEDHENISQTLPLSIKDCHILLAEDVEINREIVLAYMEDTGVTIDCAENGIEVLELLNQNPEKYDLIFMDVQMPEMDGLEATRIIRERGFTIPIVAMTANVFREDIEKCLSVGMNSHLGKPLDMNDVIETVAKYCNKKG